MDRGKLDGRKKKSLFLSNRQQYVKCVWLKQVTEKHKNCFLFFSLFATVFCDKIWIFFLLLCFKKGDFVIEWNGDVADIDSMRGKCLPVVECRWTYCFGVIERFILFFFASHEKSLRIYWKNFSVVLIRIYFLRLIFVDNILKTLFAISSVQILLLTDEISFLECCWRI